MPAVFVAVTLGLILALELVLSRNTLAETREDQCPEERLVDPDEVFNLIFSLKNRGKRYLMFLKLEEQLPPAFVVCGESSHVRHVMGGGNIVSFTTWLKPHREAEFRLPVSIVRRGVYPLGELKVCGGDFLGLRQEVRRARQYRAVLVAPREADESPIFEVLGGFIGDISVRRFIHEDPVLTAGFREYTGREPMKAISWTQSARGQGLMVKRYDYTSEPTASVILNVDSSAPGREALLERCFSMTRTVCRMLEERGVSYDFLTNADMMGSDAELLGAEGEWNQLGDGLGANHFAAVLERLALATYYTPFSGERLLEKSVLTGSGRGRIIITPGDDFGESRRLGELMELTGGNVLILRAEEAVL